MNEMSPKIVDSRPWYDGNGNHLGTIYTVCCENEDETHFVEVNVSGDDNSLEPLISQPPVTDPAAYAAFVRLYMELIEVMEMDEADRNTFMKNCVMGGFRYHKKYVYKNANGDGNIAVLNFGKPGSCLYGLDFEEYVNETWVYFLGNKLSDIDSLAADMQKRFYKITAQYPAKYQNDYKEMVNGFMRHVDDECDKLEKKIAEEIRLKKRKTDLKDKDSDISTRENLEPLLKDIRVRIENKIKQLLEEFEEKIRNFEKTHVGYPTLQFLLMMSANNVLSKRQRDWWQKKEKYYETVSLDDEKVLDCVKNMASAVEFESDVIQKADIEWAKNRLDDVNKIIIDKCMAGYNVSEIAKDCQMSVPAISKRMKKHVRVALKTCLENNTILIG